ncbi:MAG: hypothetical protein KY469_19905 [Actinobacteria bacterium]|nr:hypothetical protein [Actinomycetota bacterium]
MTLERHARLVVWLDVAASAGIYIAALEVRGVGLALIVIAAVLVHLLTVATVAIRESRRGDDAFFWAWVVLVLGGLGVLAWLRHDDRRSRALRR